MNKSQQIFNINRKAQILRKEGSVLHLHIKDVIYDELLKLNEIVTEQHLILSQERKSW